MGVGSGIADTGSVVLALRSISGYLALCLHSGSDKNPDCSMHWYAAYHVDNLHNTAHGRRSPLDSASLSDIFIPGVGRTPVAVSLFQGQTFEVGTARRAKGLDCRCRQGW